MISFEPPSVGHVSRAACAALLVCTGLVSGCATVYEDRLEWSKGWRDGEVAQVGFAGEFQRPSFYECVRKASPEQLASQRFALVEYREMGRRKRRAVPLDPSRIPVPGEKVYVNIADCSASLEPARNRG